MKRKLFYLFALGIFLFSSCAKETVYLEAEEGSVTALEGTKWKLTSFIIGQEVAGQKSEEDIFAIGEECSTDNIAIFNKGGVFIFDEGPTKCETTDPQQETGKWALSTDKKKLTLTSNMFNDDPNPVVYDITHTSTKLILSYKEGVTITVNDRPVKTDLYIIVIFAPQK